MSGEIARIMNRDLLDRVIPSGHFSKIGL